MIDADLLLVEDSPADVELVNEVLEEFENKITLHTVKNGVEALDFLHQRGDHKEAPLPDLILLDLDMPKMDGFEFLEEIKSEDNLKQIPTIILTMSNAREDILKAYQRHASCSITKPLGFEEFKRIMEGINDFWFSMVNLPPDPAKVEV